MSDLTQTIKLRIHVSPEQEILFQQMTEQYRQACNFVSQYIFDNQFNLAYQRLNKELYSDLRALFGLKSQLAQSSIKTTIARYKTVKQQLFQKPFKYKNEDGNWKYITKTLEWLWKPIFSSARKRIWFVTVITASWITAKACLSTPLANEPGVPLKASHFRSIWMAHGILARQS